MRDQPLAQGLLRALIVAEPELELARRERRRAQRREQLLGVLGVGARQRGEDARGGPSRELSFAHRLEQRLGQRHHGFALLPGQVVKFGKSGQVVTPFVIVQNKPGGKVDIVYPKDAATTGEAIVPK